jgi:cell division protein FtsN
MSDKPSLYVVEKKEVVILVILFVLVTVLAFTMGVRYGESVGKKAAKEQAAAEVKTGLAGAEMIGGKLEAAEVAPAEGKAETSGAATQKPETSVPAKESVDKNTDEFLLNALKETGLEPPGGAAPEEAKLPQEVKKAKSGYFVIQVGSHPTRSEAESQARQLRGKQVNAEILPPFKDRQGEWHRLVIGSYKTKREAEKDAASLKAKGAVISYFVWRLP